MSDEGGVNLRIDANTAAYIAKLSQLADSHEKVTKHVEGWGTAMDHVVGKMAAVAGPLVLIEELARHASESFQEWKKNIEDAGKSSEFLVNKLREITAKTGENRQAVESQLTGAKSSQSAEERVTGFGAFRENAPTSAARIAPSEIAAQLALAETAGGPGYAAQIAGIAGNVEGVAGGKPFDLAALLMARTGSNADAASSLMRRLGEKGGPQNAQSALPYLLASAQAGDRRFSFVTEAENDYDPSMGNFSDFMANKLQFPSDGQRGLAASIERGLPQAKTDIAALPGFLAGRAAAIKGDEVAAKQEETKSVSAQSEIENLNINRDLADEKAYAEANRALYNREHPIKGFINSLLPTTTKSIYGRGTHLDFAMHPEEAIERNQEGTRIREILEEQNAILRQKQLRVGAHDH